MRFLTFAAIVFFMFGVIPFTPVAVGFLLLGVFSSAAVMVSTRHEDEATAAEIRAEREARKANK